MYSYVVNEAELGVQWVQLLKLEYTFPTCPFGHWNSGWNSTCQTTHTEAPNNAPYVSLWRRFRTQSAPPSVLQSKVDPDGISRKKRSTVYNNRKNFPPNVQTVDVTQHQEKGQAVANKEDVLESGNTSWRYLMAENSREYKNILEWVHANCTDVVMKVCYWLAKYRHTLWHKLNCLRTLFQDWKIIYWRGYLRKSTMEMSKNILTQKEMKCKYKIIKCIIIGRCK